MKYLAGVVDHRWALDVSTRVVNDVVLQRPPYSEHGAEGRQGAAQHWAGEVLHKLRGEDGANCVVEVLHHSVATAGTAKTGFSTGGVIGQRSYQGH